MKRETIMNTRTTNTGFKGISKRVRKGRRDKFEARLNYKSNSTFIGNFNTIQEAVTARTVFITNLI